MRWLRTGGVGEPLQGDNLAGRANQKLAVVADQQHGLRKRVELALQPALPNDVQEVVWLVQDQVLCVGGQQHLQRKPLLLAARKLSDRAVASLVEGLTEHGGRAAIPETFLAVAAGLAPACNGVGVADAGRIGDVGHQSALGSEQLQRMGAKRLRGDVRQQVTHRGSVAARQLLRHVLKATIDLDHALARAQLAGEQTEQGALADPVHANQGGVLAVTDAERDVAEEQAAARMNVFEILDHDGHADPQPSVRRGRHRRRSRAGE
jgi:hypothetical protein